MNHLRALLLSLMACAACARATLASPLCLPPGPPDAGVMRAAGEECLLYLGWNGAGTADAKSQNQTEQLLAEEEVQKLVSQIDSQATALLAQALRADPGAAPLAEHLPVLLKTVATHPAALYVSKVAMGPMGPDVRAGLVINTGDQQPAFAKAIAQIEALVSQAPPGSKLGGTKFEEIKVGGATLHRLTSGPPGMPAVVWGFKDNYFLLSVGADAGQELVGRLSSQAAPPAWMAKLREQVAIERPGTTWYINVAGILQIARPFMTDPKVLAALDAFGLQNITSVSSVGGFDSSGMAAKTLIATAGDVKGVLALLAGKPLTAADLQSIPKDATLAVAARLDLADALKRVLDAMAKIDPAAREAADKELAQVDSHLGMSLAADLLPALGDVWCFYSTQPKPATKGAQAAGNVTFAVSVRDRKRLDKSYQSLVKILQGLAENSDGAWTVKQSTFRGNQVYYVPVKLPQAPAAPTPVPLNFDALTGALTPCWCLTENRLVISANPQGLKDFLTRDSTAPSLAAQAGVADSLKGSEGASVIAYQDTAAALRASYPGLQIVLPLASAALAGQGINIQLPALPALATLEKHARPSVFAIRRTSNGLLMENRQTVPLISARSLAATPVGIALLLPSVQSARAAARRATSTNNLKQIGLAMHNFADANKWFPASAGHDAQGKPLLSWRVYILPYLGEQELYNSFNMAEPWDSEQNRPLVARMPAAYNNPDVPQAAEGKTNYLAVVGPKAAINDQKGTGIADFTDGTSNTIMVVEANADRAVVWTKPDDWTPDEKNPLAGLVGLRPGVFLALFADASVRTIHDTIDAKVLNALFTRNGGEVIPPGATD